MHPLAAGLVWLIAANLIAMLPTKDHHWRAAYGLIATGLPLLVWIQKTHGALWTVVFVLSASSILRWPLYFAWKWARGRFLRRA